MFCRCDKCGATTRWYDEKCPDCGAAQTVEIPPSPIALPRFAPTQSETTLQATSETQEKTTLQETPETQDETTLPRKRSQRLDGFLCAVDAWRSALARETASVTVSRGRVVRYALGIVGELLLCPPCAILAAYFFTRALLDDRRARYHAAMQETEKARKTLAVGLGVFAAFLCAFIVYVRSQEITAPSTAGPNVNFFKN